METLSKKDIKNIAGALERATQNLMGICCMMLKKERNGEPDQIESLTTGRARVPTVQDKVAAKQI